MKDIEQSDFVIVRWRVMPKVSIIVPVYNAQSYLPRCLDSLFAQTYQDFEVIAIDDGSKDNSFDILKRYEEKYDKMRAFTQTNQGIGKTRNFGLQHASGTYVVFVDSDDEIVPEMLAKMVCRMEREKLDVLVCDYRECMEYANTRRDVCIAHFATCAIEDQPLLLFDINSSPWNKMYRRNFLLREQILFPEQLKYEDAQFVLHVLCAAKKIAHIEATLYVYRIHKESETTSMDQRVFDIFAILDHCKANIIRYGKWEVLADVMEFFAINRLTVYNLQQVYQSDAKTAFSFIDRSYAYLNETYPNWRNNPYFKTRNGALKRRIKACPWLTKCYVRMKRSGKQ